MDNSSARPGEALACDRKLHLLRCAWEEDDVFWILSHAGGKRPQKLVILRLHLHYQHQGNPIVKEFLDTYHIHFSNAFLDEIVNASNSISSRVLAFLSLLDQQLFLLRGWREEPEVSSDDNEMVEVKVLMALVDDNDVVSKKGARNVDDTKVSILGVERSRLSEHEGFILPNHDTGRILPAESQRNTTDSLVDVIDSSVTNYDSADESLVCSTPLPPLEKLVALAKGNKSASASKINSTSASKLKNVKIEDDPPLAIVMKELNELKLKISRNQSSYSRSNQSEQCKRTDHKTCDHVEYMFTMNMSQHLKGQGGSSSRSRNLRPSKHLFPPCIHYGLSDHLYDDCINYPICDLYGSYDHDKNGHNRIFSLRKGIKPRNPQHVRKGCETCSSIVHTITDHNDIEWLRRGEALQAKKAEALKSNKVQSSNANISTTPTKRYLDSRCSRHMTGVKSYLHKYRKQPGPKVVFGDDSTCTTEGHGSIKYSGIVLTKVAFVNSLKYNLIRISQLCDAKYIVQFDEKRRKIFNSNKEVVMIASRVRDVYVLNMTSSPQETCFFAKDLLLHKRLAHLNFKTIIKFTKPLLDNINIFESERYPPDEYLHPYEPSQRYQTNNNNVSFIEPCKSPEPVVLETEVPSDPNGQADQNDQSVQTDEMLNDDQIIDNLLNIEDIQISEHLSSPNVEDRARILTRAMAKELSTALGPECQLVDFLSEEESKKIKQSKRGISINQEKYVNDLLKKYGINGSSVKTPMVPPNNLGPDLNGKAINETQYRGFNLKGYSDFDYARCNMDRKSTLGAYQLLGGKLMCRSAKKQQSIAMSSAEAEYVAVAGCCANILWMKSQLTDYDIIYEKVPIFCDNTSAIAISNNPVLHSRTKHIDIRYHFIRDHILKGDIELHFIPT
ncbi:hypothetical protein Tco_0677964 [Tanacetum coccineum]|uniref:Retrovirus-related Pol polyprotein from transposon TNT 1-94-like beta-barrel domain-containing protein n=1 Tax=Tanacetum coccineum TaxID=301880 RepID=A0ABQ4XEU7_9ASTR